MWIVSDLFYLVFLVGCNAVEPILQLSVGVGGGNGSGSELYPERPNAPDCGYYRRNGFCGYGARCRFNHPPNRSLVMEALRATIGEHPERFGQAVCQYYMKTGMCKFGAFCKYHHPRQGEGYPSLVTHNIHGYPLRPNERKFLHYMRTGQCKYDFTCKFHHHHPLPVQEPFLFPAAIPPPTTYPALQSPSIHSTEQYGMVFGNWPVLRPTLLSGSYLPRTYGPTLIPPEMVPMPDWTSYLAFASPVASQSTQSAGVGPVYGPMQLSASTLVGPCMSLTASPSASINIQKEFAFLNRPGQPECRYCVKFGECKYGSSCKYHHPPQCYGSSLRPGAPICSHYSQVGVCKFGPSCKFDHPLGISYSPSASFLADMPVAPYPGGSFVGTLDPSSSSSDLRPELVSGSSKEVFSTQASSMSAASDPVGSMFSKGCTNLLSLLTNWSVQICTFLQV
ncbi:hypothetical protein T459_27892 [Capsicum annuum]|uniref:C3H1-type domain-containing protein n=1 Tax=Capsicum annuum TaxID=4072 RepID=A0A2G2YFA6_CAPAN|nr:hypothetical protein T459_27892 [Capsicum annuum]